MADTRVDHRASRRRRCSSIRIEWEHMFATIPRMGRAAPTGGWSSFAGAWRTMTAAGRSCWPARSGTWAGASSPGSSCCTCGPSASSTRSRPPRGCRSAGRSTRTAAAATAASTASRGRPTSTSASASATTSTGGSSSRSTRSSGCAELRSPRWAGDPIAMGTNTDPYQPAEGRYRLTRGIVEVLAGGAQPVLDPHQVHPDRARRRPARRGPAPHRGADRAVDRLPRLRRLAGDRAAHAEPEAAHGDGRAAERRRRALRGDDRAGAAGHLRLRRAARGGRRRRSTRARPSSRPSRCICAARCGTTTSGGSPARALSLGETRRRYRGAYAPATERDALSGRVRELVAKHGGGRRDRGDWSWRATESAPEYARPRPALPALTCGDCRIRMSRRLAALALVALAAIAGLAAGAGTTRARPSTA